MIDVSLFADSSSGLGALGFNGSAFVIQLITFILGFLVLRQYAFKPIIKILRERRETIESGVKLGEQMRKERAELEEKVDAELHKARKDADAILAEAHDAAIDISHDVEAKARKKADGIIAEAKERTALDVSRARKQLEQEVVSLISDATEAIIDEKIDPTKDAALLDKAMKEYSN
jgi:F-type H+-transporting ATPase subunit b